MSRSSCCLPWAAALPVALAAAFLAATAVAANDVAKKDVAQKDVAQKDVVQKDAAQTYTLRYRFEPGQTLRWEVEHRAKTDSTVSSDTQCADTLSRSVKAWRVLDVRPDGSVTFEHLVESVDMRQQLTGRSEVRYNSQTDAKAPLGFEDVARSVGKPLSVVTMDARGKILHREHKQGKAAAENEGYMTIPLPEEAVSVGHAWSFLHDVYVPLNNGTTMKIKTRQSFQLVDVKTGVATIKVENQILTPVDDPKVESQLLQRHSTGTVRFDVDAGRVLSQEMSIDKQVVGFSGEASSVHYLTSFNERLLPAPSPTVAQESPKRR